MRNSASGGYLKPVNVSALPPKLSLVQFLQTVFTGISGLPGELVRPKWQPNPPKEPDLKTTWASFGITVTTPDSYAYTDFNTDTNTTTFQRHETIEIAVSFFGPDATEVMSAVRDGFLINQNLEALTRANMGYLGTGTPFHVPELVGEVWRNRLDMTVMLRREVQRNYPIVPLVSASGTISTVTGDEDYLLNWQTAAPE